MQSFVVEHVGSDLIRLPPSMVSNATSLVDFVEEIFPNVILNNMDATMGLNRVILTHLNKDVIEINELVLD